MKFADVTPNLIVSDLERSLAFYRDVLGEDHARLQRTLFAVHDPRRLVPGEAEPVPGAVHEVVAEARRLDHCPRRPVDGGARCARPHRVDAGLNRFLDHRMDEGIALARRTNVRRPCDVGGVAVQATAEIDRDCIFAQKPPGAAVVMRVGAVRS